MNSKTICIISPSLQNGGIERSLITLSEHFVNRGHSVVFITCRSGYHFFSLDSRIILREPHFSHNSSFFFKLLSYFKIIIFIRKQLIEFQPDTILSFGDIINPFALLANIGLRFPIYISDRISPKQDLGWFKNFLKKLTYHKATGIICQSENAAIYKRKIFGNNINLKVIPNSLRDIEKINIKEKKNHVIGVGRLSYEKGFDRLIAAFALIHDHKNWKLIIVGDGPEKCTLKKQVNDLRLNDRIIFLGARKDIDYLLAESSIFVMPSRYEGFPNALCEAMASPLPCIVFDSIAANLIKNHVNGIVIQDGDIEGLAVEIQTLMDNRNLRQDYAKQAYNIRQKLDKEKIGDIFLNFILKNN